MNRKKKIIFVVIGIVTVCIAFVPCFLAVLCIEKRIYDYRRANWTYFIPELDLYVKLDSPIIGDTKYYVGNDPNHWDLELTPFPDDRRQMPDIYYVKGDRLTCKVPGMTTQRFDRLYT